MPNANPGHRQDESPIPAACDQPVLNRIATVEDVLCEMRRVQELQLRRMKRLEALFDTLAERIEAIRGQVTPLHRSRRSLGR
jgi:hypothetical protein